MSENYRNDEFLTNFLKSKIINTDFIVICIIHKIRKTLKNNIDFEFSDIA